MPIMLLQNFLAAKRKRNLIRFALYPVNQDVSWIDDNPLTQFTYVSVTYASSMNIDTSLADIVVITLTGNVSASAFNYNGGTPPDGVRVFVKIVQDAAGNHTFAFPANLPVPQNFAVDDRPLYATLLPIQYVANTGVWEFFSAPFTFKNS